MAEVKYLVGNGAQYVEFTSPGAALAFFERMRESALGASSVLLCRWGTLAGETPDWERVRKINQAGHEGPQSNAYKLFLSEVEAEKKLLEEAASSTPVEEAASTTATDETDVPVGEP